jgi:hypothetical protein
MKFKILIVAFLSIALVSSISAPRAAAEPVTLTVLAIVGLATVATASSVDIITTDSEDSGKEMRAATRETGPAPGGTVGSVESSGSGEALVAKN